MREQRVKTVIEPFFSELKFIEHFGGGTIAQHEFEKGYGISVICGRSFYSNGIDTYEVDILMKNGNLENCDVCGYLTIDNVDKLMKKIADRPKTELLT